MMKTIYFNKRSEMTGCSQLPEYSTCEAYRTRLLCDCRFPFNRRNGILIINKNEVVAKLIRCRGCRKEAGNGTV